MVERKDRINHEHFSKAKYQQLPAYKSVSNIRYAASANIGNREKRKLNTEIDYLGKVDFSKKGYKS